MQFRVRRIDHVEVFVRDLEASARWYRDVLGLEETRRWVPEPVMIGVGGTNLALFLADAPAVGDPERGSKATPRWHRVAWTTDEAGFGEAQAHLERMGVPYRGPVDHGTARSVYFSDPDGHPLEITYYL